MTPQQRQAEKVGPLKGHYKRGRKYVPPLLDLSATVVGDWKRTDLPDLLWPVSIYSIFGTDGIIRFVKFQGDVLRILEAHGQQRETIVMDGRLSSLELCPEHLRNEVAGDLRAALRDRGLYHENIVHCMMQYQPMPGSWLLVDADTSLLQSADTAMGQLATGLVTAMTDRHVEALIKFLQIAWQVQEGSFRSDSQTIELLKDYPLDQATIGLADTAIRAIFNAQAAGFESIHPERLKARNEWARHFWRRGWDLSPCMVNEPVEVDREVVNAEGDVEEGAEELSVRYANEATAHYDRFLVGLFEAEVDLDQPARSEVISGLVSRLARSLVAVLGAPQLWSGEHLAHVTRTLAETEITLDWMHLQGSNDIYEIYQSYGHGKAKLARRHMKSLLDSFPKNGPKLLRESIEHSERRAGGAWGEEFTVVDLGSTFCGKSLREMASEVGLEDLYRHVYQQSSAVAHGEWWTLEDYAMQRCANPLHRFHYLPSMEPIGGRDSEMPRAMLKMFGTTVNKAIRSLSGGAERFRGVRRAVSRGVRTKLVCDTGHYARQRNMLSIFGSSKKFFVPPPCLFPNTIELLSEAHVFCMQGLDDRYRRF